MERKNVESNMIKSIGYDPKNSTLEAEFDSGAIWQYYGVSKSVYANLKRTSSVGIFFKSEIIDQFSDKKINRGN